MRLLFLGDIVGRPGRIAVQEQLPALREAWKLDCVIINGENSAGGFGTLVPAPDQPEVKPTVLLVPLAAFDRRGYRIGYGKGYYDRALTELGPTLSIGIGYAAQEIGAVPDEPHDRRLDWIVTERETLRCG